MKPVIVFAAVVAALGSWGLAGEKKPAADDQALAAAPVKAASVEHARRQAEILHAAMHATLQIVHHRYYVEDEGLPLPAFALKEVFADVEREEHVKLRWLVVEGQAMNTDHQAETPFEHEAVRAIKDGKPFHEQAADGLYRRAAPVLLTAHCLKCHFPNRTSTATQKAGLVITIPVKQ
jgi:hypothetical protein